MRADADHREVELRCEECGQTCDDDTADGWEAHLAREDDGHQPETVVFCPSCSTREFGIKVASPED